MMNPRSSYSVGHRHAVRVLQRLQDHPNSTTHTLAEACGISYQVCGDVLRCLRSSGYVVSTGVQRQGNKGAQPARYCIMPAGTEAAAAGDGFTRRKHDPRPAFTRQVIVDTLRQRGPLTRRELVAKSGLGLSTLVSYVPSLKAEGVIASKWRGREVVFHATGV